MAHGVEPDHELRRVGAVEAVDAVGAHDSRLQAAELAGRVAQAADGVWRDAGAGAVGGRRAARVEEARVAQGRRGNLVERRQHEAVLALGALGHVPRNVHHALARGQELVQVLDRRPARRGAGGSAGKQARRREEGPQVGAHQPPTHVNSLERIDSRGFFSLRLTRLSTTSGVPYLAKSCAANLGVNGVVGEPHHKLTKKGNP